ncbi:MAG: tetratricopeptide repeat protein [Chloroflexi bacterium]|nr:tetratricopeptide repeat protein [Chloroflexota bacterium]
MARLSLSLMGPFQATLDGQPVTSFESDRVRALLAYLAVESNRPHRREGLATLLWPNWPDRSALTNLRNALSNLRKAIGDRQASTPILQVTRETIQFDLASDSWVDVQMFQQLAAGDQSLEHLDQAIQLYRGPFLDSFGLKDSAPFEEWVQMLREQLSRQCLAALEQLAKYYEQQGDLSKATEYAWKQTDLAPWHERAHQRLMRLLALNDQRSTALAQYETCRRLLQQELGIEPSPETIALYEQIRDGKLVASETPQPQSSSPALAQPSNLPVSLSPFIGRKELLAETQNRLQDSNCRLLTLIGPGGSGKTRLAIEAAAAQAHVFAHGVHFVSLAPLESTEAIVPTLAQTLGFSFEDEPEPLQQLLDHLRQKQMLLVLDNFEHLLKSDSSQENSATIVTTILQAVPQIKVLVTSQIGLNLQGEFLLPVPGMSYPEQSLTNPSDALEHGAIQLFLQSARRVHPNWMPTDEDLTHVIEICRLVQGMPLGLMLAAAWMRILSPAEIVAKIAKHHGLDFLEAEWHDVPERQRSMRAVFDYSWRLLNEREQQSLAALSIFRGSFTYSAARQVANIEGSAATLRELLALVNSSLLQHTSTGRYEMHELLRQYAKEQLRAIPDAEQMARDRHADYYTAALRRWATELEGAQQQNALAEMDRERNNIRAAWAWSIERRQVNRLAEGMAGLGLYYDWRTRYQEGEKTFLELAERLVADDSAQSVEQLKLWGSALAWHARFSQRLGQTESARELAQQSLDVLEELTLVGEDVRPQRALALQIIGEIELHSGNSVNGREPLGQSLSLYRELGNRRSVANCLRSLGRLAERMGKYEWAVQLHQESVEICRTLGTQRDLIDSLLELSLDLQATGHLEDAERLRRESIAISEQLGDRAGLTTGLYRSALSLIDRGKFSESHTLLEQCVKAYADLGDRHRWALALMRLGNVKMHLGQYEPARSLLQESLNWYREVDNRWGIGASLWLIAELEGLEGRYSQACELLQESAGAFRRGGARADVGRALADLGIVTLWQGAQAQAREYLAEACHLTIKFHQYFMPVYVLIGAAMFAVEEGNGERAVELWARVCQVPTVAQSRLYQDMFGKRIAAIAATLSREKIAAAEERGRARDLWAIVEELQATIFHP